jgi:hypothetical protein
VKASLEQLCADIHSRWYFKKNFLIKEALKEPGYQMVMFGIGEPERTRAAQTGFRKYHLKHHNFD